MAARLKPSMTQTTELAPVDPASPTSLNKAESSTVPLYFKGTIDAIVGPVTWLSDVEGFVTCPGEPMHTHRSGKRDCKLYLDRVPTLTCFHSSCRDAVEEMNRQLRRALAGDVDLHAHRRRPTPEEKSQANEVRRKEQIRRSASFAREAILNEWAWPYARILGESPSAVDGTTADHWRTLLSLFNAGDVVWIGGLYDSGKPEHASHFLTKEQWLCNSATPGQFVCPAIFKPGSFTRSNDNIVARRFLVVESDELTKDQVGGVFRWLQNAVHLKLRAIVDTAGTSLHGWFDFPDPEIVEDLKLVLPQLGCDPKLFSASQPVRLPGALRDGKHQRLVWLNQGGAQ